MNKEVIIDFNEEEIKKILMLLNISAVIKTERLNIYVDGQLVLYHQIHDIYFYQKKTSLTFSDDEIKFMLDNFKHLMLHFYSLEDALNSSIKSKKKILSLKLIELPILLTCYREMRNFTIHHDDNLCGRYINLLHELEEFNENLMLEIQSKILESPTNFSKYIDKRDEQTIDLNFEEFKDFNLNISMFSTLINFAIEIRKKLDKNIVFEDLDKTGSNFLRAIRNVWRAIRNENFRF